MRYLENGVEDKDNAYFFDNQRFDIQSYFIYFDSSMQWIDLVGLIDTTDATFAYPNQDFSSDFMTDIALSSNEMFTFLTSFRNPSLLVLDDTHTEINSALKFKLMNFIDKINYYNQFATKHSYYDHGIANVHPFAEFIVIKLRGTDTIVQVMLNRFITKSVGENTVTYTLNNELQMSKYLYNYSTEQSDFTSIYLKLLYNQADLETVNRESMIISEFLWPVIQSDSSKLYMDLVLDSTSHDLTNKYTFFDLSTDDLIFLNNKYFCKVKDVVDSTTGSPPDDYTFSVIYSLEFLELDNTSDLSTYMNGEFIQYDFTKIAYQYKFNIRSIKKLRAQNSLFVDHTDYFKTLFTMKTFFGYQNRSSNTTGNDQKNFFGSPLTTSPAIYSGTYDATNNLAINLLSMLNTFYADKYILPYDVTILKSSIGDKVPFDIDLFIANSNDITNFFGNYVRNGIYIFNEANTTEVMVLRLNDYTQINSNAFRLNFVTIMFDSGWYSGIPTVYSIPSNSWLIQWKYHIYNVMPYIQLDKFMYSNDLNNLINMHLFGYLESGPESLTWNGNEIQI